MARILVTDGKERSTLAAVRSLGRAGHLVFVAENAGHSLASSSRYCAGAVALPSALDSPTRFVEALGAAVLSLSADVLIPISEVSLLATLSTRDALPQVRVPFPPIDRVRLALDKLAVSDIAASLGIAVPRQVVVRERADAAAAVNLVGGFPVVIKPARSVVSAGEGLEKTRVAFAQSWDELLRVLSGTRQNWYPLLLQQRVFGSGTGVFVLLWDGALVASFSHRRIREKPPSGGVSVLCESIALDQDLLDRCVRLLRKLEWHGVAMIELKRETHTDTPYLMEVNGRFWGSLQLAVDAGVDFPALLVACALGMCPPAVSTYRVGIRSRWWWGDVDHVLMRLLHKRSELSLGPDAPGRLRVVWDFLSAFGRGTRGEVSRLRDPVPGLIETLQWVRGLAR